ncbi:hypothetical protein LJK88_15145 [Paenibacillus sp. P26]|nr:hypothetical protein LJK88_15145 [Paenibacillus sp. P26]
MSSMRVLFQGDSITDGGRSRNNDLNHVLGHGYAYIIASRLGNELAERRRSSSTGGLAATAYRICMRAGTRTPFICGPI